MDIKEYQKDVRKQFYDQLCEYCEDPDRYFDKIFQLMPNAYKIPSYSELISTLSCILSLITHGQNQERCSLLIDQLPWYKYDFHYQVTYVATPIEWAVYCNRYHIVENLIVKHHINPNLQNRHGKTLLHEAVRIARASDALRMVRMLLDRGADPRILAKPDRQNFPGESVLDYVPSNSLFRPDLFPEDAEELRYNQEMKKIILQRIAVLNQEAEKLQIASFSVQKEEDSLVNSDETDEPEEVSESTPLLTAFKESCRENSPHELTHRAKKGKPPLLFSEKNFGKENNNDHRPKLKRL